eukprot:5471279-Prorocentrum_lima.AAC.1
MTSSLVGSEMCIRDSIFLRRGDHVSACKVGADRGTSACFRSASNGSRYCLLYTSDAADDM